MTAPAVAPAALELADITAGYGETVVLRNLTLTVPQSSVTALLGPNGAGKTTLLRVAVGLLKPKSGAIRTASADVTKLTPHERAKKGVCLIPEGRGIFRSLTVQENLQLQVPPWDRKHSVDAAVELFPPLANHLKRVAGTLSGGEQQMVALSRARLANPSVILLDEVSMGLAPLMVDRIFDAIHAIARDGAAIVLVEQYVKRALEMADTVAVLSRGDITYTGPPGELDDSILSASYLGNEV